jgi:hypothetical protein
LEKYKLHVELGLPLVKKPVDYSYADMTDSIGGQSIPQPYHDEGYESLYEEDLPGKNGYDQSGMEKRK